MIESASYDIGATDTPLLQQTIGSALDAAAAKWADGLALVSRHQGLRWTWAELRNAVDAVASWFAAQGLQPGERVGIWAPNCAEWTIVQLATAKAGLILVTINPAYRTSEVEYALNKVGCAALVTAVSYRSSDYLAMLREIGRDRMPNLRLMVSLGPEAHEGFVPFRELSTFPVDTDRLIAIADRLDPNDAINIQFTSGTTGFPKGATLTHRNILNNGYFAARQIQLTPADRLCVPVPLYHCFGMVLGNLACLTSGAAMVYPGEVFEPSLTLEAVEIEGCTALYGVPTMFIAMLNLPDFEHFELKTLRTGIMAGSPCPVLTMCDVIDRMNMTAVTIGYGMTETSPLTTQTATDDPLEERVGTVGRVHPHAEAKIVGPDGKIVPRGKQGEYCARGYAVMLGYWGDPDRTAEAIDSEGWMHSGDLAVMDERGYVRITGRIKDMIIRGGENVYPKEIEEFLTSIEGVTDAQVFGVDDPKFGEEVCAWLIQKSGSKLSEADVRLACRGKIAHYKIPKYVRFVDSFILTVTGKPQKFEMRKAMEAELGLCTSSSV
jgi:fatty-acyl-CoA synthase